MYVVAVIAVLAATAGWNYQHNDQNVRLSDLALENVEALASGEGGAVRCCPDPGDECKLSSGDILKDQDEC